MKLEVGMYVRTKYNGIFNIQVLEAIRDIDCDYIEINYIRFPRNEILKTSHNLIDLIELMDLMYIDICPDDCGGIVVPRIAETLRELNDFKERFASGNCILKSVVTHEQIRSICYEVSK